MQGMRGLAAGLVVAVAAGLVGCQPKGPADEWAGLVHPDVFQAVQLKYYWRARSVLPRGETVRRMYRLDEKVYLLTSRHRLVAYGADTGLMQWARTVSRIDQPIYRPIHANDVTFPREVMGVEGLTAARRPEADKPYDIVLINTLTNLLVFDRGDGELLRDIPLDPPASTGGATDGENFYVGSARGWYYAVYLAPAVKLWTLSSDGPIAAPLEWRDQTLYVADEAGMVHAVRTALQGRPLWHQQTRGPITAPMHVDERGLFVASEDQRVYVYDGAAGTELPGWTPFRCGGPIESPLRVGRRTLFVHAARSGLYALDVATGRQRWALPQGRMVLAVMEGKAYVLDEYGNLVIVDEMLGQETSKLPLTGLDLFVSDADAPAIYAATREGQVFCIRPMDAEVLTVRDLRTPAR